MSQPGSNFVHQSLHTVLKGEEVISSDGIKVVHFRGIPYGTIPRRFAKATLKDDWKEGSHLDCTKFGPQCPQNVVDFSYLLRIPDSYDTDLEVEQDEFRCLNLNVSVPAMKSKTSLLPVLIWIYGGSQVVSYPPASHKCSDTTALISKSCGQDTLPIITVTFNYRVNIFGFGDGSQKNLALKDQRLAIEWVVKYIGGFGGDKDNITLGGESAGAVYTQAHLCSGAPVRRGILQSGSLFLSSPLPYARGDALIESLSKKIEEKHHLSLGEAPVSAVLQLLKDQNVNTLWIQEEPDLAGWQDRMNDVEELLIGDVEYESVIWKNGLKNVDAAEISTAFDTDTEYGPTLRHIYGVSPARPDSSRIGALDFINDVRFALPSEEISDRRRAAGKKTYQYVFDQSNPWNKSSRAHHCVDLLFLFPALDCPYFDSSGDNIKHEMLRCWTKFITGKGPWDSQRRYAFGPLGKSGEISDQDFAARRRVKHFGILRKMDPLNLVAIFGKLAAGRISLLN